jgi:hypothetical protein
MSSIWCSICPTNLASTPNLYLDTDSQIRQHSGRWGRRTAYVVTFRNILKIDDLGLKNPSTDVPAYGVITRWGCPDLMLDEMRAEVHNFEDNGAMILRYCTILTGPAAGRRLLIAGYPSMDAIQNTYEALRGSAGYNALLQKFDLDWRNIMRVTG